MSDYFNTLCNINIYWNSPDIYDLLLLFIKLSYVFVASYLSAPIDGNKTISIRTEVLNRSPFLSLIFTVRRFVLWFFRIDLLYAILCWSRVASYVKYVTWIGTRVVIVTTTINHVTANIVPYFIVNIYLAYLSIALIVMCVQFTIWTLPFVWLLSAVCFFYYYCNVKW